MSFRNINITLQYVGSETTNDCINVFQSVVYSRLSQHVWEDVCLWLQPNSEDDLHDCCSSITFSFSSLLFEVKYCVFDLTRFLKGLPIQQRQETFISGHTATNSDTQTCI